MLNYIYLLQLIYGYRLMVDRSSSKRTVPIRIRLAVKIQNKKLFSIINYFSNNKEYNLIGKIGSFKLQIISSSLSALDICTFII